MAGLTHEMRVALVCVLAALVLGYLMGHLAGQGDAEARLGFLEDGSYPAGCLADWPCDDTFDTD